MRLHGGVDGIDVDNAGIVNMDAKVRFDPSFKLFSRNVPKSFLA
jgi:hypothetical protein